MNTFDFQRIRLVREHFRLSIMEFSQAIGMSKSAYDRAEKGQTDFPAEALSKICSLYDVDPEWLMSGKGGVGPIFSEEKVARKHYDDLQAKLFELQEQLIKYQKQEIAQLKNIGSLSD